MVKTRNISKYHDIGNRHDGSNPTESTLAVRPQVWWESGFDASCAGTFPANSSTAPSAGGSVLCLRNTANIWSVAIFSIHQKSHSIFKSFQIWSQQKKSHHFKAFEAFGPWLFKCFEWCFKPQLGVDSRWFFANLPQSSCVGCYLVTQRDRGLRSCQTVSMFGVWTWGENGFNIPLVAPRTGVDASWFLLSHLDLGSLIAFLILRVVLHVGVRWSGHLMWSWLFSLKFKIKHACAYKFHCFLSFPNRFLTCSLHQLVTDRCLINVTLAEHGYPKTWMLWNWKDTYYVSYKTKTHTEWPAMNPSCDLWYGTVRSCHGGVACMSLCAFACGSALSRLSSV